MIIKNFFENDINRNIETVIKADDRDNISTEVAEYVITQEIAKKIRDLFQGYNNYAGANGVWISGFFGSGKSHLLKIISYVLENKEVNGYKCGDLFAEKIEEDLILKGDVISATRIPSESILFNIDQQAQITSKEDKNAVLSVFYKVFYDHLGYYGFQPHVAEFEMWLDKQGKFNEFTQKFDNHYTSKWVDSRSEYFDPLVVDAIAQVLGDIFGTDASKYENILDTLEDRHKQSIEDFCIRVNDYIKLKPSGFRLNFFVDEVGQYISDNTKLMLNLQTIAETLATTTKGNSWIMVTSQEDMEKVVGDMNKSQQNDFSRIQARFKIKVPLTSSNVDEVIEKRLLKKNTDVQKHLASTYKKESSLLESLLSFSNVGRQFKGFKNDTDFANKMPFVAYQFDLFQECRRALSTHNAFQGKHSSVGERSMLGVFQQVIQNIETKTDKDLVSFDLMFDGLRSELKGEIQKSVIQAERNLSNPFAIRVLKALFLVKYFSEFKTTKRNISVLMLDNIEIDVKKHESDIDEALNILENESYVERNGDIYQFLTDDEKDVEEEIKNTDIDDNSITGLLNTILFDEIIGDSKIKFIDNKQDYEFTSKIDGITLGREKELGIEIVTENYHEYSNDTFLVSQTMGSAVMKVILPSNAVFMKDVKMYLRTEKYNKQNQSTSNKPEVKRILQEKAIQNQERKRGLVLLAKNDLANSQVIINGTKLELGSTSDGKTLIINAFQNLIKSVYPNLRMLGTGVFSEDTFKQVVRGKQDDLFGTDDQTISEAEQEILTYINRRKAQSDRTSLNDLKTQFSKKPYGWYQNATWTVLAKLYKRGKVEVKRDSNTLDDEEVLGSLLNTSNFMTTLLEPQAVIDQKLVIDLKKTYSEAFNETCPFNEARDVANAFKDKLKEMSIETNQLFVRKNEFHFLKNLEDFSSFLDKLLLKDYVYYLTNRKDFEDELLDAKEDLLDPIKTFINGDQSEIYTSIRKMVEGDTSNFVYAEGNELEVLKSLLNDSRPFKGNLIKEAKTAKDEFTKKVIARIDEEKANALAVVEDSIADLKTKEEFIQLDEYKKSNLLAPFKEEVEKLQSQRYIGNIREIATRVKKELVPQQLNEMVRLLEIANKPADGVSEQPMVRYIQRSGIKIDFSRTELKSEEDIEEYVNAMKKAFLEQINNNRRITL